jgi:hypothetical protein
MALGFYRTHRKSKYRRRPKWGGRPGPTWDPRNDKQAKRRAIPRAFAARAQHAHSAAAVDRRADAALRSAKKANKIGAFFGHLVRKLQPQFKPDPPPAAYRVEIAS